MSEDSTIPINSFDFYLPLPYRVVILINVGLFMWHLNLITCKKFKIGLLNVLKFSNSELTISKLIESSRLNLLKISSLNLINYLVYYFFTSNGFDFLFLHWLPLLSILITFLLLIKNKSSIESQRLSQTFKRIIKGDIDINLRNNDILLTDTLTSYNKVLVDFFIYISALFLGMPTLPIGSDLSKELSKSHLQLFNLDLLLSNFPSFLRLKQCLKEYNQSNKQNIQHLFNAIKYSTAFLPTFSMILFKTGYLQTLKIWYFFTFINSSYSLFWDITNDWNFGFLLKFLSGKSNLKLLRNKLLYSKTSYILAILIDTQLRFIWIYKLLYVNDSTLDSSIKNFFLMLFTTERGNFILEILEIFRRWVWVFIKIETEYIKLNSDSSFIELQNFE